MSRYEIKPSVKLIFNTTKEILIYGDMPLIAIILFNEFSYSTQEILKNTPWNKSVLSKHLKKGNEAIKNPMKKIHYEYYLKKIDEKFQIYLGSINKEMIHLKCKV